MKHWCRYRSACWWIASTTGAKRWPVFWQPIPPAKSTNVRPSTSVTRAPSALATTSRGVATPFETYRRRSARIRSPTRCSVEAMCASMTQRTRVTRPLPPRNAQAVQPNGFLRLTDGSLRPRSGRLQGSAPPQAGIRAAGFRFCGIPLANRAGAVCHTTRLACVCNDSCMETATTILIVDDHPSFRRCARAVLESDGFSVVGEAEDGEGALSAIDRLHPDVVLLDIQLPDMDGFSVLDRLGDGRPARRARLEPGRLRLQRPDQLERRARVHLEGRSVGGRRPLAAPVTRRRLAAAVASARCSTPARSCSSLDAATTARRCRSFVLVVAAGLVFTVTGAIAAVRRPENRDGRADAGRRPPLVARHAPGDGRRRCSSRSATS